MMGHVLESVATVAVIVIAFLLGRAFGRVEGEAAARARATWAAIRDGR